MLEVNFIFKKFWIVFFWKCKLKFLVIEYQFDFFFLRYLRSCSRLTRINFVKWVMHVEDSIIVSYIPFTLLIIMNQKYLLLIFDEKKKISNYRLFNIFCNQLLFFITFTTFNGPLICWLNTLWTSDLLLFLINNLISWILNTRSRNW